MASKGKAIRAGAKILGVLLLLTLVMVPVAKVYAVSPFTFDSYYGTGALVTYAGNPAVEATSAPCAYDPAICPYSVTYGGAIFDAPSAFTIGDISVLSVQYFMQSGDCGNGAPRFSLWLDPSGDTEVWIYLGPTNYGGPGCTSSPWQSTGNLAGTVAVGQSSNSVFVNTAGCGNGNTAYSWAGAVACLGSTTAVYAISLDVDGGTSTNSQDALFNCNSITINSFTFPSCGPTNTVPEFPFGLVALLAVAVPLMVVLRTKFVPRKAPGASL